MSHRGTQLIGDAYQTPLIYLSVNVDVEYDKAEQGYDAVDQ